MLTNKISIGKKLWSQDVSYLLFNVTNRCNAFCDHCFNWKKVKDAGVSQKVIPSRRDELSLDEIERFVSQLPPMLLVNLCGGEPFMREDLPEIVKLFNKHTGVNYITIPSNGFLTEVIPKQVARICHENPNVFFRLSISLDGFAHQHDEIRRHKGGFDKAIQTAKELNNLKKKYSNFSLGVSVVFSAETQSHIEELIQYLHRMQLFDILSILCIRGNPHDMQLLNVDLEKYEKANDLISQLQSPQRHPANYILERMHQETIKTVVKAKKYDHRVFKCYAGQKMVVVDDVGEVFACEILENESMGNLRDFNYNLKDLLCAERAIELVEYINDEKCACSWECAISTSWLFNIFTASRIGALGTLKSLVA